MAEENKVFLLTIALFHYLTDQETIYEDFYNAVKCLWDENGTLLTAACF